MSRLSLGSVQASRFPFGQREDAATATVSCLWEGTDSGDKTFLARREEE